MKVQELLKLLKKDGWEVTRTRGSHRQLAHATIYERGKHNWSAYVPDLPGCIATGKTRKQVEKIIREAIQFHIEGLKARGEPVPEPSIEAGMVSVAENVD